MFLHYAWHGFSLASRGAEKACKNIVPMGKYIPSYKKLNTNWAVRTRVAFIFRCHPASAPSSLNPPIRHLVGSSVEMSLQSLSLIHWSFSSKYARLCLSTNQYYWDQLFLIQTIQRNTNLDLTGMFLDLNKERKGKKTQSPFPVSSKGIEAYSSLDLELEDGLYQK